MYFIDRPDFKGIVLVASLLRGEFAPQMRETLGFKYSKTPTRPDCKGIETIFLLKKAPLTYKNFIDRPDFKERRGLKQMTTVCHL